MAEKNTRLANTTWSLIDKAIWAIILGLVGGAFTLNTVMTKVEILHTKIAILEMKLDKAEERVVELRIDLSKVEK